VSASGATKLFSDMIASPDVSDNTSFKTLAMRLNQKVLKSRQLSSAECV
jgi:hypothetical protein